MRTLLFIVSLSTLLFMHCTGSRSTSTVTAPAPAEQVEEATSFHPDKNIIARRDPESGEYEMEFEEKILIRSFRAADFAVKKVEKVFIQHSDDKHAYLIFHARDTLGNSLKKALYLQNIHSNIYKIATPHYSREPVSHVCEGNCCNECEFKIKDNKLDGCECAKECPTAQPNLPGYCNHVIGKTAGPVLVPVD